MNTTAARVGRPRREEAGDVNARILAAATDLFLEKGVAATSCEAVVARARVGKASLYSRYSGKDALFEAVVRQAVDSGSTQLDEPSLPDANLRTRIAIAGKAVLTQAISPVPLELMRLFLTEARRFPDLIFQVDRVARAKVLHVISGSIEPGSENAEARDRADKIAERFLDLAFAPIILAALMGRETEISSEAIDRHIGFALDVLEQSGLLDEARLF